MTIYIFVSYFPSKQVLTFCIYTNPKLIQKVGMLLKGRLDQAQSRMKHYQDIFLTSHVGKSVEELWTWFTESVDACVDECTLTKLISGKQLLPWITQETKRLIRRPDRLYSAYKAAGDSVKKNFQVLRRQEKRKIKRSYQACLEELLGLGNNNESCDRKCFHSLKDLDRMSRVLLHSRIILI